MTLYELALPLKSVVRYQATDTHLLQGYGLEVKVNPLASEAKYAYVAAMQDLDKHIRFVEAYPMTLSGKVQKFKMREFEISSRGLEAVANRETA